MLRVWPLWERLARRLWPTVPIPAAPYGALSVHMGRYHGEPIVLPDGTRVHPGDRVIELHMNNRIVFGAVSRSPWHVLHVLEGDLRALAAWVADSGFPRDAEAVYGVTLLGRGAARLGFMLHDRPPSVQARLDRLFMTGLLALYSRQGLERLSRGTTPGSYPQEIWMSRAQLLLRYGEQT